MAKKRILQILRGSGAFGGVASYLISRYALMDHDLVEFCFLFCQDDCISNTAYVNMIGKQNIFELNALKQKNGLKEYWELYNKLFGFLSKEKFDFIHINTGSLPVTYICLKAAKKAGATNIIAHSHSSNYRNGALNTKVFFKPIKNYMQNSIYKNSNYHFACSKMAAQNMFGNRMYDLMCNSIDVKKFGFDREKRIQIREKNRVDDYKIYGFVGRLSESKNINFLIEVFKKILDISPKSKLWIVGDGAEKKHIQDVIDNDGLNEKVVMFGNRNDVNELMQAMDVFIFPSLYEGLSLTVIEAQAAGLPVYMSDTLSEEHKITELVHFLPLTDGPLNWARCILSDKCERKNHENEIRNKGYELLDSVKSLEDFYTKV